MSLIYDWYKNTPGAVMPNDPNSDTGMQYWANQVNKLGAEQAYGDFARTINAMTGKNNPTSLAQLSFQSPVVGQTSQVRTDPNNPNTLETLYSGIGYNINPAWGAAAANGGNVSGIQKWIPNNNFGNLNSIPNMAQTTTPTQTTSPSTGTTSSNQTLATLFPRQDWSRYQSMKRGSNYFNQDTGNVNLGGSSTSF